MFGFGSAEEILDATVFKRPKPKAPKPLKASDGTVIPEEEVHRLPGTERPAVLDNGRRDHPLVGKKCSMRRCRETAQFTIHQRLDNDFAEVPAQDYVPSDNPLAVQLELAQAAARARPAVMVDTGEPVYLCIGHYGEFMAARNARVQREREARQAPSWPLYALNYEGAVVSDVDSKWFTLTDGDGKSMRLEIWHLDEVNARMAGKTYYQQVLTRGEVEELQASVKTDNFVKLLAPKAMAAGKAATGTGKYMIND